MDQALLDQIEAVTKNSAEMPSNSRFTRDRYFKLCKLQRNLRAYRDNLTDMLVTIREMENALNAEIDYVGKRS